MTTPDIIQFAILIVLVVTAIIAAYEVRESRKVNEQSLSWNRMNKTQDVINDIRQLKFNEPKLGQAFRGKAIGPNRTIPLEIILAAIENDTEVYTQLAQKLNENEGLARGIFLKLYDEDLVKLSRRTLMTQVFYEYNEYIIYRREISNPRAWRNFEDLIMKWGDLD